GLADLIVGARGADPGGNAGAGSSYVVFGKSDSDPVNLSTLGTGGFRIDGIDSYDSSGISVSGAGDVNGDGLADLIVGASYRYRGSVQFVGESYVIFGKTSSSPVDLAQLANGGFRIEGVNSSDFSGYSVSGAGDVNGDGLADLVVGARLANPVGTTSAGGSYVVFGKASSTPIELGDLGTGGFQIVRTEGIEPNDSLGESVSGAGDVNGDGLADLIVGAGRVDVNGLYDAGQTFVVFGKSDNAAVNLSFLGSGGFRIDGIEASARLGGSVSGAGDVNGDGLADLIVGARYADAGEFQLGQSYLLFGKASSTPVDLANLGTGGFTINGADGGDTSGTSVSGAGDVNGDGLADVIIGAPYGDDVGNDNEGHSYVLFSASTPLLSSAYRVRSGNGDPPRTAVGINGDGSNDSMPDARFWIDFSDGDDLLSSASTEIVTLSRSAGSFPQPAAQVSWRIQTNRQNWTAAEVTVRYLATELLVASEGALQLSFSPTGSAPFTPLSSEVNAQNNTLRATITEPGFIYIGEGDLSDELFFDRFESTLP
ncbi:MAG: integrin alpha, partial [Wenzhouxiangella sp.]|nr:integrin alpha [Wenzhouxiangella sp.]